MNANHPTAGVIADVVVADDDIAVREALADLVDSQPDLRLVGIAADHESAIALTAEHKPHVLVLDLRMPKGDAPTTIRTVRGRSPRTRVITLSSYDDRDTVLDVLAAGAAGYLVKGEPAEEILEAVRRATRGQFSMSADLTTECAQGARRTTAPALTEDLLGERVEEASLALLDAAPCGVLTVRTGGRIESANPAAQRLFGYRTGQLTHHHLADLLAAHLHLVAEQVARGTALGPVETTGRRRDGTEFPLLITASPLQGRRRLHVVYLMDRTDPRSADDSFRQLVESSPDAFVIVDAEGRIQQANAQTSQLFGHDREHLTGASIDMLLPDQPLSVSLRNHAPGPKQPAGRTLELVARRADGKQFPAEVSVSALHTAQGPLAVLVIRDITEVQRAQFVLERSVELLEAADRDRQPLLAHLVQAQEQERGRIAADIHDDTIQVVTAAHLRLQQLRRHLHDPGDLQLLDKLEEMLKASLSRLRQLIFDLRPTSLEHGSLAVALRTYLEHLRSETGTVYRLEDRLAAKIPAQTSVLIYRTAQEALTNVRKHARATTVRVQLLSLDDGALVRIVDDGVGYNPLEVETRPGHLGLTLIHERAEIAGGWSRIESTPGAGTTVEFWVPLGEPDETPTTSDDTAENNPGGAEAEP